MTTPKALRGTSRISGWIAPAIQFERSLKPIGVFPTILLIFVGFAGVFLTILALYVGAMLSAVSLPMPHLHATPWLIVAPLFVPLGVMVVVYHRSLAQWWSTAGRPTIRITSLIGIGALIGLLVAHRLVFSLATAGTDAILHAYEHTLAAIHRPSQDFGHPQIADHWFDGSARLKSEMKETWCAETGARIDGFTEAARENESGGRDTGFLLATSMEGLLLRYGCIDDAAYAARANGVYVEARDHPTANDRFFAKLSWVPLFGWAHRVRQEVLVPSLMMSPRRFCHAVSGEYWDKAKMKLFVKACDDQEDAISVQTDQLPIIRQQLAAIASRDI